MYGSSNEPVHCCILLFSASNHVETLGVVLSGADARRASSSHSNATMFHGYVGKSSMRANYRRLIPRQDEDPGTTTAAVLLLLLCITGVDY